MHCRVLILRAGLCTVLCVVTLLSPAVGARQPSLEYDIKAAFVLNFVRYVEWPDTHRTPPLRVCILQPDPFRDRLDALVNGERWQGAAIDVRRVTDLRRSSDCHLLYVPEAAARRFPNALSAVAGQPILTVGEHERFLEQGGMIRLFREENRVRFSINQRAADAAGLTISSRLLRLARSVIDTPGGR